MKDLEILKLRQLEEVLAPFKAATAVQKPRIGWVRMVREALGMTNAQLAKRLGRKAPQTVEDMQQAEIAETIKLKTLRELAEAMGCRLVYAIVPVKSFDETRQDQARLIAMRQLKTTAHSMRMEDQAVTRAEEADALQRQIYKLLSGNPKKLWD